MKVTFGEARRELSAYGSHGQNEKALRAEAQRQMLMAPMFVVVRFTKHPLEQKPWTMCGSILRMASYLEDSVKNIEITAKTMAKKGNKLPHEDIEYVITHVTTDRNEARKLAEREGGGEV